MTTPDQYFNFRPLQSESYVVAGSFIAESPEGRGVVVEGPPSLVWAAHITLQMHGFKITPRAGHFWGPDELRVFPRELESSPLDEAVADIVEDVLAGTERARAMYFYDYRG